MNGIREFRRHLGLVLALIVSLLSGCSCHLNVPEARGLIQAQEPMTLYDHPFDLRLFKPTQPAVENVLIVYATGDGGWLGLGSGIFKWLTQWNFPVVGFSSRAYLRSLGYVSDTDTTSPRRLAKDYASIIGFAESRLELPSTTSLIFVGLSRGAGLSVVAAGEGEFDSHLAGLLAIALTKEEEHVLHRRPRFFFGRRAQPGQLVQIETYSYLRRLAFLPVTVLQSTHDGYLPAAAARRLFGPDTDLRRLRAIEAANHGFQNGCPALYNETEAALKWIVSMLPKRAAPGGLAAKHPQ
jgi:hypothetical protein